MNTPAEVTTNAIRTIRLRELATTKDQAGYLPVSPATIRRWVRNGTFPKPFKLGASTTVWDVAAVDAFLAQRAEAGVK